MTAADEVTRAVGAVMDPELRRPIGELGMVRGARVDGGTAWVDIALTVAGCPAAARIESDVRAAALSVPGVASAEIAVGVMDAQERARLTEMLRAGRPARSMPFGPDSLTRVIAVTSGKGGVGNDDGAVAIAGGRGIGARIDEGGSRRGAVRIVHQRLGQRLGRFGEHRAKPFAILVQHVERIVRVTRGAEPFQKALSAGHGTALLPLARPPGRDNVSKGPRRGKPRRSKGKFSWARWGLRQALAEPP